MNEFMSNAYMIANEMIRERAREAAKARQWAEAMTAKRNKGKAKS